MDLTFSDEQELLKNTAREFIKRHFPPELVRELEEDPTGFRADLWKQIADLGWPGWVIPPEYEGIGGKFTELIVLMEEMGRGCFVGPLFSTLICTLPIIAVGTEEQKKEFLPKIAQGKMILSLALTEPSARYDAEGINTKAVAEKEEYAISGTKLFVHDAQVANCFLCATRTKAWAAPEEGISLFLVDAKSPGITITPLQTIADDKQCEVVFDKVRVPKKRMLGQLDQGFPIVKKLVEQAAILKCAEMIGGADWVVENCVAYAQERVQYGKPIGSYGIIQHYLAEMWSEVGMAKRLTYYVSWLLEQEIPCTMQVAMGKAWVSDTYRKCTRTGVQVFGGIGTTRDHDMGLYYRRARQALPLYGDPDYWREVVAQQMGL